MRGFECDAHADRGVGKDRRPFHATLRELRPDPERAVEKQSGRLQTVELAIEVVEPHQHGNPVLKQVLLNPGLVELDAIRSGDAAHALRIADETAWQPALEPEAVEIGDGVGPTEQDGGVDVKLEIQVAGVRAT